MKSKILLMWGAGRAGCSLFLTFFLLLSVGGLAQNHSTGAILLDKAVYDKLPRANWDTLRKYSNKATIGNPQARTLTGITMLVNPPIGDQGQEGSCVGWAVG